MPSRNSYWTDDRYYDLADEVFLNRYRCLKCGYYMFSRDCDCEGGPQPTFEAFASMARAAFSGGKDCDMPVSMFVELQRLAGGLDGVDFRSVERIVQEQLLRESEAAAAEGRFQ